MHWILLAIIAIALIALASRYPKSAFALLGVLLVAGLALYQYNSPAEQARAQPLVASDTSLQQMLMTEGYANGFDLSGRITNESADSPVTEFVIKISMHDCASQNADDCQTIGEKLERIKLRVPPGQSRDFSESLYFDRARARETVQWEFEIVEVSGR